jgi:hypothetical protein
MPLLLTDETNAWVITTAEAKQIPADELRQKAGIPPGPFAPATWDGREAFIVNLKVFAAVGFPPMPEPAYALATHEAFHSYVQRAHEARRWPALDQRLSISRSGDYPAQGTPRVYRAMVYNSLVQAYQDPDQQQQHLAAAAYWHNRWIEEFPTDAGRRAPGDIAEGTARYFEYMMRGIAAGDEAARKAFLDAEIRPATHPMDAEDELYEIGAVAGLLLDRLGRDWKEPMAQGSDSPSTVLLKDVEPSPQPEPPQELRQAADSQAQQVNDQLKPAIDPLIAAYKDTSVALLVIPAGTGSVGVGGYFLVPALDGKAVAVGITGSLNTPSGSIESKGRTFIVDQTSGQSMYVLPLTPDTKHTLEGSQLTLNGDTVTGKTQVRTEPETGRTIYYTQ